MTLPRDYPDRVAEILRDIGISPSYGETTGMPLQPEATELIFIDPDIYGRKQKLSPNAAAKWQALHASAKGCGIDLQVISAFRSIAYQKQILERKLAAGEPLEKVLRVSAAPGYSEHHTGCALDLTTPGCAPLTEDFDRTPAFAWLVSHARNFGFAMTYPRNNKYGLVYEPWHWACLEGSAK